jgi:hypothetical protein
LTVEDLSITVGRALEEPTGVHWPTTAMSGNAGGIVLRRLSIVRARRGD